MMVHHRLVVFQERPTWGRGAHVTCHISLSGAGCVLLWSGTTDQGGTSHLKEDRSAYSPLLYQIVIMDPLIIVQNFKNLEAFENCMILITQSINVLGSL